MQNLKRVDPVARERESGTPCFRDPRSGKALTVANLNEWVKLLMRAIARAIGEQPDEYVYGSHSLRIGGATAAMYKAGCSPLDIKVHSGTMGFGLLPHLHSRRPRACDAHDGAAGKYRLQADRGSLPRDRAL